MLDPVQTQRCTYRPASLQNENSSDQRGELDIGNGEEGVTPAFEFRVVHRVKSNLRRLRDTFAFPGNCSFFFLCRGIFWEEIYRHFPSAVQGILNKSSIVNFDDACAVFLAPLKTADYTGNTKAP